MSKLVDVVHNPKHTTVIIQRLFLELVRYGRVSVEFKALPPWPALLGQRRKRRRTSIDIGAISIDAMFRFEMIGKRRSTLDSVRVSRLQDQDKKQISTSKSNKALDIGKVFYDGESLFHGEHTRKGHRTSKRNQNCTNKVYFHYWKKRGV